MTGGRDRARLAASHWVWLFVILLVWSAFDYWDHISRPGSVFAQAPIAWLGFTVASFLTLFAIARVAAWALGRFARLPELPASTLGILLAVAVHLLIAGPLWDRVFWMGRLQFDAVLMPAFSAALLYLFYRAVFTLIQRLMVPPRSRA